MKFLKNYLIFPLWIISSFAFTQNNALDFDGSNDYITIGTPLLPTSSAEDNWTVEFWMNTLTTGFDAIASQYTTSSSNRATFGIKDNLARYWKSSSGEVNSVSNVNDGNWHHIAFVREGSGTDELHLFVNGVLEASGTDNNAFASVGFEIGRINNPADQRNFPGKLDDLRIWNDARTATEINANMNTELSGNELNLIAYYNFNQGTPNGDNTGIANLIDSSPNGNNGSFQNFSLSGTSSNFVDGAGILSIPTMGEWSLIIFALILLSISTIYVMHWEKRLNTKLRVNITK